MRFRDVLHKEEFYKQRAELDKRIQDARERYNSVERNTLESSLALRDFRAASKELNDLDATVKEIIPEPVNDTYKGQHSAPDKDTGSPLYDVTINGIYPKDFYNVSHQYMTDEEKAISGLLFSAKNRPNMSVIIYRAIPKEVPSKINVGDWVTISKAYAKYHGVGNLNNNYKIVQKTVYARDIFTAGDYLLEWGYDPQPKLNSFSKSLSKKDIASS